MHVRVFEPADLTQLLWLVNLHLGTALPGWALSEVTLARHLERDDTQPITDPWVVERETLCAVDGQSLLAAAHLLHYGPGAEVSESYCGAGSIAWLLSRPDRSDAAEQVLQAAQERMVSWGVGREYGWDTGLPAGPLWGVPDAWPHVEAALLAAGYRPDQHLHREAVWGGWIEDIDSPSTPPVVGLSLRRGLGSYDTRFATFLEGREIGQCDVQADLTHGGTSPALSGWAWLVDLEVEEAWRNRGIGSWLVRSASAWLRLAGCDRVVLSVSDQADVAGAGRFYRRFGWAIITRETHGWRKSLQDRDVTPERRTPET